jgi:hypothetical protein
MELRRLGKLTTPVTFFDFPFFSIDGKIFVELVVVDDFFLLALEKHCKVFILKF